MIRINLLPHRQMKRAQRQRDFNGMAAMTFIAAAVIVFFGYQFIDSRIEAQNSRNTRLSEAITKLDKQIESIKELRSQISAVLERKQVVENLQTNRSQAVVLLDEIARQLPEGMYLRSIKQKDTIITIEGVADTNARVATLVRNLTNSNWLESPNLMEIKSSTNGSVKQNSFVLNVGVKKQITEESDAKKSGKKAS